MVAIGEYLPSPFREAIDRPRDPDAERPHAAPERVSITCLDDEVRVVPEQRIVNEPKVRPLAARHERPLERPDELLHTERRELLAEPDRHVHRQRPREGLSRHVRHPGLGAGGLPPGPGPPPAPPPRRGQRQAELCRSACHLETAKLYTRAAFHVKPSTGPVRVPAGVAHHPRDGVRRALAHVFRLSACRSGWRVRHSGPDNASLPTVCYRSPVGASPLRRNHRPCPLSAAAPPPPTAPRAAPASAPRACRRRARGGSSPSAPRCRARGRCRRCSPRRTPAVPPRPRAA